MGRGDRRGPAIDSEASLLLTAALSDPGFLLATAAALTAEPDEEEASVQRGALHLSPGCQYLYDRASGSSVPECRQCTTVDGNTIADVFTGGLGALGVIDLAFRTRPGCAACQQRLGLDLKRIVECLEAVQSAPNCSDQSAVKPWEVRELDLDEHACQTRCDTIRCKAVCNAEVGAHIASCLANQCVCAIQAPLCALIAPTNYCSDVIGYFPAIESFGCKTARCGDGKTTDECTVHPELVELCDPTARSGNQRNGTPCRCAADCKSCGKCECDRADESSWPSGKQCNANCALEDAPKCEDDVRDFFLSSGKWCDPKASANWCAKGSTCSSATCRCEEPKDPPKEDPPAGSPACGTGCVACVGGVGRATEYLCATLSGDRFSPGVAVSPDGVCYLASEYTCCSIGEPDVVNKRCDKLFPVCSCCRSLRENLAHNVTCLPPDKEPLPCDEEMVRCGQ